MTTAGYGDIFPKSYVGQWNSVILTFCGVMFEAIFLASWARFVTFSDEENDAFCLLKLRMINKEMRITAASIIAIRWKLKVAEKRSKN